MASHIDWRRDLAARAKASGLTLPEATLEEMAEHLDEIYLAAIRDGASDVDAEKRARAALEESAFDILRARSAPPLRPSPSPFVAAPVRGRQSLNIAAKLHDLFRSFLNLLREFSRRQGETVF